MLQEIAHREADRGVRIVHIGQDVQLDAAARRCDAVASPIVMPPHAVATPTSSLGRWELSGALYEAQNREAIPDELDVGIFPARPLYPGGATLRPPPWGGEGGEDEETGGQSAPERSA